MHLPAGVEYRPACPRLVAMNDSACIRISTRGEFPANGEYQVNDRTFETAITPYLVGDWQDFDRVFQIKRQREARCLEPGAAAAQAIYSGAEHRGNPKLPNITILPNLSIQECRGLSRPLHVLGCTMGHTHPPAARPRIQEIYEFQSYGLLVLDNRRGAVELWIAKDGDKVVVPDDCHMTLYNLDDESRPLVTLDFADPCRNPADKDLVKSHGPILLGYYDDNEVTFVLNRLYVNNSAIQGGVQLNAAPAAPPFCVRIDRRSRYLLGEFLYRELTGNPEVVQEFARLGLKIRVPSAEAVITQSGGGTLRFARPLAESMRWGTPACQAFFPDSSTPPQTTSVGKFPAELLELQDRKRSLIQLGKSTKNVLDMTIVVEGAGEWVEKKYRPMFKSLVADGNALHVFYFDDTSWSGQPPTWITPPESWEKYLDKANSDDLVQCETLNRGGQVDVVFVVTPDFTHSAVLRQWLGKSRLILVEKPFDSHLSNLDEMLRHYGTERGTACLGLDHYQFYALGVPSHIKDIDQHLGGALKRVHFFMCEKAPIALDRVRTLQHGMTLDMTAHLPALLTYFGDISTIDNIRVHAAGRYTPLIARDPKDPDRNNNVELSFRNETFSHLEFTFEDYSGSGCPVPCSAIVGKGCTDVKYLEVWGQSGNAIRVDLLPPPDAPGEYPWSHIMFLQGEQAGPSGGTCQEISDPFDPSRRLRLLKQPRFPLDRDVYKQLLVDLLQGTNKAVASTLMLFEAVEVVRALDRFWSAVQATRPAWHDYPLGQLNPLSAVND